MAMKIFEGYRILNICFVSILIFLFIYIWEVIFINPDAAYYLSVARDISNGNVLYKDIYSSYTPVQMYLNAILYKINEFTHYKIFVYFQLFIILLSSLLFYLIQIKQNHSKGSSLFMSLIFTMAIVELDGTAIVLEPYCIFFVMLAYLSLLYEKYFITGAALALCVFSKQYGALNLLPFTLLIIFQKDTRGNFYQPLFKFIVGGLIILLLFLTYFIIIHDIEAIDLFNQISGKRYAKSHFDIKINPLILSELKIAWLVILVSIYVARKKRFTIISIILFLGLIINLTPLFIKPYPHYFLLALPYAFLIYSKLGNEVSQKELKLLGLVIIVILGQFYFKQQKHKGKFDDQVAFGKRVEQYFPKHSEIFLDGSIRNLYILNQYNNPLKSSIGYSFEYDLDTIDTKDIKVLNYKKFEALDSITKLHK